MTDLLLINFVLFLPLFVFIISQLFNGKSKSFVGIIFATSCLIGLFLSIWAFANNSSSEPQIFKLPWFSIGKNDFVISLITDRYVYQMLILVNFISLMVGIFSIEYMRKEPAINRYFGFIGFFLFAMNGIILSGNLFQMYFFWELVGFSSYLLIGFWYEKPKAILASKKAFLMNRVGDICFLIGIFLCFQKFGDTEISHLIYSPKLADNGTVVGLLLFGGCMAKSAQFPLHTWLPDAMEGPTPISALIHAATMVAAGIYLIIRIFPVFSPDALTFISVIGCISMVMAAVKAFMQTDIKKVLAYSTISQLGLMVMAVGGAAPNLAFNHLLMHGFFKAGLFLSAGSVIHSIHQANHEIDAQNMYLMGGLRQKLTITFWAYCFCAAAMVGLPLFSGFITKDQIVELWHFKSGIFNNIIFSLLLITTLLSAAYMVRQIFLVFFGKTRSVELQNIEIKEDSFLIKMPIIILAFASTFIGASFFGIELGGINFIAFLCTTLTIIGLYLAYFFREKLMHFTNYQSKIDQFYQRFVVNFFVKISNKISKFDALIFDGFTKLASGSTVFISNIVKWFDESIIDGLVSFMAWLMNRFGKSFNKLQSGQFQWYISAMVLILIILFMVVKV